MLASVLAVLTMLGIAFIAQPASAAPPVYQITGKWAAGTNTTTTSNGHLVTAEWRVNVNDSANPPANDPVPNVNFTVTATHGKFAAIPQPCKTTGVTPKSSISADGGTLVCNLGTVKEGTAEVVQAPMVVYGATGDKISATGTIGDQTASVPPIPIRNGFGEDMLWSGPSDQRSYTKAGPGTDVAFAMEWTLRTTVGSDPGPANINFNLTITNTTNRGISVGAPYLKRASCTQFNYNAVADGHPFSGRTNLPKQNAPFVKTCTLVHVSGTRYQLQLRGIDYSKALLPTLDSAGRSLGATWQPVASGSIWLTMHNMQAETSVVLKQTAPGTYKAPAPSTRTATDASGNNTSDKDLPLPGNWSASWNRPYTHSGGTNWDNTYKVPALTQVEARSGDNYGWEPGVPNTAVLGECVILDTKYVTYASSLTQKWKPGTGTTSPIAGAHFQYYTGAGGGANAQRLNPNSASYNPNAFTCDGNAGWVNAKPANGAIRAVRVTFRRSAVVGDSAQLLVVEQVRSNAPVGRDVWMFGSTLQGWKSNHWIDPARDTTTPGSHTRVPGSRYRYTTGARDVLHVIGPTPLISKSASPTVVTPGQQVTYTLRYQMQGGPGLKFNNVKIVDTLPPGVTYVAGSATPAPTVNGRTLTWTLNGVPSNTQRSLTFKATVGSITPGQALTNNVTMTYGKQTAKSSAQITGSTSGYTSILKSSDLQYIPNLKGDGSGTDSWTVTITSNDPLPQPFTDTIDILPYNGDGRGTSFSGTYTIGQITPPAGATVYYTTADRSTLSDDPYDKSNGTSPGSIAGNTVQWSITYSPNATAIRIIGPALKPGATQQFKVPITTAGAKSRDTYVNRAQGVAGHTQLVMRTSAKMTMAQYYAATLKKYVQDINGKWHDANGPADYPAFHYGDTIHYKVVVTNVGEGTLTDIDVSDDKQPQMGAFHIDSLASGKSQSHEYSITLDQTMSGNVVNNACAKAATPPDMTTAPDIPCDPAGFTVTNYITKKTADPAAGTPVQPGQVIHYTITVTQQGKAPADAQFSDDLSKVLDDADYNNDVKASIGTAKVDLDAKTIAWTGTIPVGQVATVTYSVTVHDAAHLQDGDTDLYNPVTSPGCVPKDGEYPDCTTDHKTGYYTYSKVADPKSGSSVSVGDKVTYTVTVVQHGAAAQPAATVTDDLTKVLDDATYDEDAKASSGSVSYAEPTLTWKGDLAVGATVTITYSVTVTAAGDLHLDNVVTSPDKRGHCDEAVGCTTTELGGKYIYSKVSDPASGSTVHIGDKVTYTVTVTQQGPGAVPHATVSDDLTKVLDDATYDKDAKASSGSVSYAEPKLTWTGDLAVGAKVTITYSVTVTGKGDQKLANVVTSPDKRSSCDETVGCMTHHQVPSYRVKKTASAKKAQPGDKVTYTITVTNTGQADYTKDAPASFTDDMSKVLDDATYNDDATNGATYKEPVLSWSGPLAMGKSVTITYSVTIDKPDQGDGTLHNVVVTPPNDGGKSSGGNCPIGSSNLDCATTTGVGAAPAPPLQTIDTGKAESSSGTPTSELLAILGGTLLALAGAAMIGLRLRRRTSN